jgi:UDP-N-acetylglucosamine 2-epimerase (non-hydrolysing)
MSALKILNIIGCRTNFIKIMPLIAEMKKYPEIYPLLAYTGQHYDEVSSDVFFRDMEIPQPDVCLNVGSGSHARQAALIIQGLEGVLLDMNPDLVLVAGDVNSTVASSMTAILLGYPVAHVEAGLRSFDREMPEEINRIATDALSDILFTTERNAIRNLLNEGRRREQIFFVGSVIIDTLAMNADKIMRSDVLEHLNLTPRTYAVVSRHRSENVDDPSSLERITKTFGELQRHIRLIFPSHPRTATGLGRYGRWQPIASLPNLQLVDPLGYIDFIKLLKESLFVMTDSGGVQEESTALGIPCLTLREHTECPITVTEGTNQLVGSEEEKIAAKGLEIINGLNGLIVRGRIPEKWDGLASTRIASILIKNACRIKQLHAPVRQREICPVTLGQI